MQSPPLFALMTLVLPAGVIQLNLSLNLSAGTTILITSDVRIIGAGKYYTAKKQNYWD
jgi:hypothetical protein